MTGNCRICAKTRLLSNIFSTKPLLIKAALCRHPQSDIIEIKQTKKPNRLTLIKNITRSAVNRIQQTLSDMLVVVNEKEHRMWQAHSCATLDRKD